MKSVKVYIRDFAVLSACGDKEALRKAIFDGRPASLPKITLDSGVRAAYGRVPEGLCASAESIYAAFPSLSGEPLSATDRLTLTALMKILPSVSKAMQHYGSDRVGAVLGGCVSGMPETEHWVKSGKTDPNYHCAELEIIHPTSMVERALGLNGPVLTISTACTSSAKAIISAARMIRVGLADAVVTGGFDAESHFTVEGFVSIGALSAEPMRPFSKKRAGVNLGAGGALFLLVREEGGTGIEIAGWGETGDAYNLCAPDPGGREVKRAMREALDMAGMASVDFIHVHGTGTELNDAMESNAIDEVFPGVPAAGTKALTGHTLGGAGALNAAVCCLALEDAEHRLPVHAPVLDAEERIDASLTSPGTRTAQGIKSVLSSSFAFGGSNAVLILKKEK